MQSIGVFDHLLQLLQLVLKSLSQLVFLLHQLLHSSGLLC